MTIQSSKNIDTERKLNLTFKIAALILLICVPIITIFSFITMNSNKEYVDNPQKTDITNACVTEICIDLNDGIAMCEHLKEPIIVMVEVYDVEDTHTKSLSVKKSSVTCKVYE